MCVRWSPNGEMIASASRDKTVKLWDVKTGKALYIGKTSDKRNLRFLQYGLSASNHQNVLCQYALSKLSSKTKNINREFKDQ